MPPRETDPCGSGQRGEKAIERWDRVTGAILLIIGIAAAWSSTYLSMGKFRHPGPGFLPFGLAILLAILSLALILQRSKPGTSPVPFWPRGTCLRPLLGVVIFVIYSFLIGRLGFLPTTFLFLVLWMGVIERIRWYFLLILSSIVTVAVYVIFGYLLEVPLPMGFLEW